MAYQFQPTMSCKLVTFPGCVRVCVVWYAAHPQAYCMLEVGLGGAGEKPPPLQCPVSAPAENSEDQGYEIVSFLISFHFKFYQKNKLLCLPMCIGNHMDSSAIWE